MAKHVGLTVIHPGGYKATEHLLSALHINGHSKVIDIACGKGTSALYIAAKYGCSVTAIDISVELIDQAKYLAKAKGLSTKVDFLVADAQELPFEDNSFDVAVSQAMLVLVDDKLKTIKEAYRVLRKGGTAGWLELSWRTEPDEGFIDHVTDVLCSYCMKRADTYAGWQTTFSKAGISELDIGKYSFENGGIVDMLKDEGFVNTVRGFSKYLTNHEVRRRMKLINSTFKEYPQYFGYGTYCFSKN
jgi:ubiquinone/menaquinone biosynthesis C-methylase UbiE